MNPLAQDNTRTSPYEPTQRLSLKDIAAAVTSTGTDAVDALRNVVRSGSSGGSRFYRGDDYGPADYAREHWVDAVPFSSLGKVGLAAAPFIKRYHITPKENLKSIMKQGLKPKSGATGMTPLDAGFNHDDVYTLARKFGKDEVPDDWVQLEIKIPKSKYRTMNRKLVNPEFPGEADDNVPNLIRRANETLDSDISEMKQGDVVFDHNIGDVTASNPMFSDYEPFSMAYPYMKKFGGLGQHGRTDIFTEPIPSEFITPISDFGKSIPEDSEKVFERAGLLGKFKQAKSLERSLDDDAVPMYASPQRDEGFIPF